MDERLKRLRTRIDAIDEKLVKLLNERVSVTKQISSLKKGTEKGALYRPEREAELLSRARKLNHQYGNGLIDDELISFFFTQVMSVTFQKSGQLRIAYLGPEGTYSHAAAIKRFGERVEFAHTNDIGAIFEVVEAKESDFGVVPVENSTEGIITHTFDRFIGSSLKICSELELKIVSCLMAKKGTKDITKIYSHPQPLAQCRNFLRRNYPQAELIATSSTARAAEIVETEKNAACIGPELAAKLHALEVVKKGIQDSNDNITRFLIVGDYETKPTGHDKTSVVFSMPDRAGALDEMLSILKKANINMTKIESRPLKDKVWQYYFFVDVDGHRHDAHLAAALGELEKKAQLFKVLGSYPKAR